jgi:hypothetical protein
MTTSADHMQHNSCDNHHHTIVHIQTEGDVPRHLGQALILGMQLCQYFLIHHWMVACENTSTARARPTRYLLWPHKIITVILAQVAEMWNMLGGATHVHAQLRALHIL